VSLAQARRLAKLVGAGRVRMSAAAKLTDMRGAYRLGRGLTMIHIPGGGCLVVDDHDDDVRLDLSAPGDLAEAMLSAMLRRQRATQALAKRVRGRKRV